MTAPEPTRPADEHTGTVALDLDAIEAAALADDGWWSVPVLALVAEVRSLRAKVAAVEAELAELRHWTRRDRPRLIAATALAFSRPMILGDFDIRASDLRAALATTGEDQ